MKILVTGGCGFIGSNFIRHVLNKHPGYSIINLDALTYAGNPESLKDIRGNGRYTFMKGNIEDAVLVKKVMHAVDSVVHFAAESHVDRSIIDAQPFLTTNVMGTHVMLSAARDVSVKRFIHISTDEVYGSLGDEGKFT